MRALLLLILHLFRIAAVTRYPAAGASLRVIYDRLTGHEVIAADWDDLPHVQSYLSRSRLSGVYLLVGRQDGRIRVRVGEGVKLWNRLGDHRVDPVIRAFAEEIYVLTSPRFNKSDVVYLQEQVSEIVQAEERIDWHKGCKHLQDFPLGEDDRKALDVIVLFGLSLLHTAGLRLLQPAQSRLARQIEELLIQAGAR